MTVSDSAHDEIALIGEHIPLFCARILHVGCGHGAAGPILQARGSCTVHGIEWDRSRLAGARDLLTEITEGPPERFVLPEDTAPFDCILFSRVEEYADRLAQVVSHATDYLASDGLVLVLAPRVALPPDDLQSVSAALEAAGLAVYQGWDLSERCERPTGLVMAVIKGYDPLVHARRLLQGGHFDNAYDILGNIPAHLIATDDIAARIECEKQLCIFYWEERADPARRLHRFYAGQCHFYKAIAKAPGYIAPYHMQAEMWRRLGNPDMAARTLRSLQYAYPHSSTQDRLEKLVPVPPLHAAAEQSPELAPARRPRVLFLTHKHTDYGLDVLFDGLCRVLGDDSVTEYPWKGLLHGEMPDAIRHYPCLSNHAGDELPIEALERRLREGYYDVILCGILEEDSERERIQRLTAAAPDVPVFIVDQQDDPYYSIEPMLAYLGRPSIAGYFKREMIDCVEYPPNTWPLPFAYPDSRIPEATPAARTDDVFWAGFRNYGLRRLYLEAIERQFDKHLEGRWDQREYVERMERARIGLDFFGGGFDTVRYWELPAHGCMLLAERKPIRIPHNFTDGVNAVFFDDLQQLEDRLAYYIEHPDAAAAIAAAGHAHLRAYHTSTARAGQLLARIHQVLGRS